MAVTEIGFPATRIVGQAQKGRGVSGSLIRSSHIERWAMENAIIELNT